METVLAYVETQADGIKRSSLEILTRSRQIAEERGDQLTAVVLSADPGVHVEQLGRYGASKVFTVRNDVFAEHLNVPVLDALEAVAKHVEPELMVFPSSESVKEILGALSIRLDAAVLPDVSAFEETDSGAEALRPVLAAKFLARVRAERKPVLISVRSGAYVAEEKPVEADTEAIDVPFDVSSLKQTLRDVVTTREGAIDLSEARVVVAAGRGVRDERGKELVEELADRLGAAIGSSRAVVESGLFPASSQIGQTGKVVAPDLYVAIGISGAIQHVAGMASSRVIVAVNRDADAPIFDIATYGIVGDLYEIIPRLIEQLKK